MIVTSKNFKWPFETNKQTLNTSWCTLQTNEVNIVSKIPYTKNVLLKTQTSLKVEARLVTKKDCNNLVGSDKVMY
jgi:hypothetical protein